MRWLACELLRILMLGDVQVYIDKWTNPCQNLTTAVKLTTINTCVKVADAGTETQWEYLFLGKYGKY
jgi:hypothetical protein